MNYGFLFQSYAQLTRLKLHSVNTTSAYKVMERSIFSARCFLENMKRTKMILDVEAEILEKWYDWSIKNNDIKADLIGICSFILTHGSNVKQSTVCINHEIIIFLFLT